MPAARSSLQARLLLIAGILLIAAFGITFAVLDLVFRRSAEAAIGGQLETQVFAIIGAAELDEAGGVSVPRRLLENRLRNPGSGLYAEIVDGAGATLWRSPSTVGVELKGDQRLRVGERALGQRRLADGSDALVLGVGIDWELGAGESSAFQVYAAADLAAYRDELRRLRQQLLGWFSGVMLVLLGLLWLALRAGLKPLRRMATEIAAIEAGTRQTLGNHYPRELAGVARGLNTLLQSERQRMERYRTTMDDLAHSLKTPIAVLRTELDGRAPEVATLRTEVDRMQGVIDYQLRRAAASGPRSIAARPVVLAPIVADVAESLRKIHRQHAVECANRVPESLSWPAEQGDLYEIIGNVLDNAWKWCRNRVSVDARLTADGLEILVGDDGPGVPLDRVDAVLARGVRADQRGDVPGQGIGLAVVREIVELYGGAVSIGRADLGGAEVRIALPGRR